MDIALLIVRLCCGRAGGPAGGETGGLFHLKVQCVCVCVNVCAASCTSNHAGTKSHVLSSDVMCEYV